MSFLRMDELNLTGKRVMIREDFNVPLDAGEVTSFGERRTAPADMKVYNPAFDVAEAENISAIITEKGIIEKPDTEKIAQHLKG